MSQQSSAWGQSTYVAMEGLQYLDQVLIGDFAALEYLHHHAKSEASLQDVYLEANFGFSKTRTAMPDRHC
jgi:hypothetical protein